MSKCPKAAIVVVALAGAATALAAERKLGIGRGATPAEIAGWDIDVRPDGQGLPSGSGSVKAGEAVYMGKCAACHGEFGESAGRWPQVAGGQGSLASHDPVKTIGSYFAHLSTVFDYVRHAMPFGDAQSLTDDELYAVVAYMLFLNDIVDEKFVLSRETFGSVKMPNAGGFYDDDRETTEKAFWNPSLHDGLQARREGHRPRTRDRRYAGRQTPARGLTPELSHQCQLLCAAPRIRENVADMLGEQLGELLRVARQSALPVPQHKSRSTGQAARPCSSRSS